MPIHCYRREGTADNSWGPTARPQVLRPCELIHLGGGHFRTLQWWAGAGSHPLRRPLCASLPSRAFWDILSGTWNWPWWEHVCHANQHFFFFFKLIFKHLPVHHYICSVVFVPLICLYWKKPWTAWVWNQSQICHFLAMKSQAIYIMSLCLGFLIYKTGIITCTSWSCEK